MNLNDFITVLAGGSIIPGPLREKARRFTNMQLVRVYDTQVINV